MKTAWAAHPVRGAAVLVAVATLTALALTGCASKNASASTADQAGGAAGQVRAADAPAQSVPASAAKPGSTGDSGAEAGSEIQRRQVISTGRIQLSSADVAATRTRIDAVLAGDGGRVADENTTTNNHGTVVRTHLVVRVPSSRFDSAMTRLAEVATLRSSSRQAEDVTTQVIDLDARIRSEQAGVRRLRSLVSHTANLRALLDVERALTQRQGELESLRQQHAYLADQTGQATITVDVTRRSAAAPAHHARAAGFVSGLHHGWHGLVAVVVGLLLGVGAMLPFALAAAVVGLPVWIVYRRVLRPRRSRVSAES